MQIYTFTHVANDICGKDEEIRREESTKVIEYIEKNRNLIFYASYLQRSELCASLYLIKEYAPSDISELIGKLIKIFKKRNKVKEQLPNIFDELPHELHAHIARFFPSHPDSSFYRLEALYSGRPNLFYQVALPSWLNFQQINIVRVAPWHSLSEKKLKAMAPHLFALNLSESKERFLLKSHGSPSNLLSINLHKAAISQQRIDELSRLKNLQTLDLSGTKIDDQQLQSLSMLSTLQTLNLSSCFSITDVSFTYLECMPSLHKLDISDCYRLTDAALSALTKISELTIGGRSYGKRPISNEGMKFLTNLQALFFLDPMSTLRITDISPLTNLKELRIDNYSMLSDSCFGVFTGLKKLTIQSGKITDACISRMVYIQDLEFNSCCSLTTLAGLAPAMHLQTLMLKSCFDIEQADVGALPNLQTLLIQNCAITELHGLHMLSKLLVLKIRFRSKLEQASISTISSLTSLQVLELHNDNKDALNWLTPLTNLRTLDLSFSKEITDAHLKQAKALTKLHTLTLIGCNGLSEQGVNELVVLLPQLQICKY